MELRTVIQFLWTAWLCCRTLLAETAGCGHPANAFTTWFVLRDSNDTSVGAVANVYCYNGTVLYFHETITCGNDGTWPKTSCYVPESSTKFCPANTDSRGMTWNELPAGIALQQHCHQGFEGVATRKCSDDGLWERPQYNCIRHTVIEIADNVVKLKVNATAEGVSAALQQMDNVTFDGANANGSSVLTEAEITVLAGSLKTVANIVANEKLATEYIVKSFVQSVSHLVDNGTKETWQTLKETQSADGENILHAVDQIGAALREKGNEVATNITIVTTNVVFEMRKFDKEDIVFPTDNGDSTWAHQSQSSIHLSSSALSGSDNIVTAVVYPDLSFVLSANSFAMNGSSNGEKFINGPVLSLTISSRATHLDPPVKLTFKHMMNDLSNPACSYWKYGSSNESGYWASDGCILKETEESITVCECNHLTNFAVLMSPFVEAESHSVPLRLVSIIGIALSMACLVMTVLIYACLWRNMRKDRSVLLINLCVALLTAYVVFLVGIDRTTNKALCTAIAALLHYIYLAVFSLMLAEGVDLLIMTLYVFAAKSRLKLLLISAWLAPILIVGICLAATQTNGYGNDRFCWLSLTRGTIWGFVAPALFIIMVNIVCLILVIKKMLGMKAMANKSSKEKIKTSLRSLCVLVPLMGVSWILGIFYVNESASFMQYVFAVCNSLQGIFIFIFHCVLNKPVRNACRPLLKCNALKAKAGHKKKPSTTQDTSSALSSGLERSTDVVSDMSMTDDFKPSSDVVSDTSTDECPRDAKELATHPSTDNSIKHPKGAVADTTTEYILQRSFGNVVPRKERLGQI